MNYKKTLLTIFSTSLLFISNDVFADVTLNQDYPAIGLVSPAAGATFFVYLYNVCVAAGAFIAVGALMVQGLKILTAKENAGKVSDAKERFQSISLGLGVLLSSYLMLSAINPQLLEIELPNLSDINLNSTFTDPTNAANPDVEYTEVPMGAIIESILNSVSTSRSQAYNYSSVDVQGKHTEERCYLYDEYGNAIDKNGDGYVTELDEYQGLDFSICINELLKATEHKLLYLNGGKYRCGTPGYSDKDSPNGIDGSPGKTNLGINYHDWDTKNTNTCNYTDYPGSIMCTSDGTEGIINKLKKYLRDGCECENCAKAALAEDGTNPPNPLTDFYCKGGTSYCDVWCSSNTGGDGTHGASSKCCGGPRGRDDNCQTAFNNIVNPNNPYQLKDPCTTRRSMDCMRKFINILVFGNEAKDNAQRSASCPPQENAPSLPMPVNFTCGDFPEAGDPEIAGGEEVMSLAMARERLISFRTYYEKRLADLEKAEDFLMSDKRLEIYSRAEMQSMQQEKKETYSFNQSGLGLPSGFTYDTVAYRRKFNCSLYEDSKKIVQKNVYEDDADRKQDFSADWGADGQDAQYTYAQKNNRLIRLRTGELSNNLHVDGSMDATGKSYDELTEDQRDSSLCARSDLLNIGSKDSKHALFYDIDETCNGGGTKKIVARTPAINKKRMVAWNNSLYEKGGITYLDENETEYYTGEEMAIDGDPLTFYALKDPNKVVDPYYTGRDQMPYYFQTGFIDFSQYAENTAIDTEVIEEKGSILPSLVPVGQLSYHTKIYAKQMIRTLNRTIEQVEASILALDKLANDFVEGNSPRGDTRKSDSIGCDCKSCTNHSDCHCVEWDSEGNCTYYDCTNDCSTCKSLASSTCATCSKVHRYYDFVDGNFTPKNKETFVEHVINDNLPKSIKFIVKGMGCPIKKASTCEENSILVSPYYHATAPKYWKDYHGEPAFVIDLNGGNPIVLDWNGVDPVTISGSPKEQNNNIGLDDSLWIINESNGKEKFFLGDDHNKTWLGDVDVTEILSLGENKLKFMAVDTCGGGPWSPGRDCSGVDILYLLYCPTEVAVNTKCIGGEEYSPPTGFKIVECNAWDTNLKEERPCTDYKGDIVVTLEADTKTTQACKCGISSRTCINGTPVDFHYKVVDNITTFSWNCLCGDGTKIPCKKKYSNYDKPAIYLYPTKPAKINVKVFFDGNFTEDIPKYNKETGWNVIAYPSGKLVNEDGKEYEYLYWEGKSNKKVDYTLSEGFVVKGSKTKEFLTKKLEEIGLNKSEYDEFIDFWEPRMNMNKYNLIHFAGKEYTDAVKMGISPSPDSILRVFMVFKPIEKFEFVVPQKFEKFERKGFSVVEWGGTEISEDNIILK